MNHNHNNVAASSCILGHPKHYKTTFILELGYNIIK